MTPVLRRLLLLLLLLVPISNAQAALLVSNPLDRIVAVVNDDVITALELEAELIEVKNQLRLQRTRLPADEVLRKQLLDRMILRQIQLQLADRARIRVDDERLNRALERLAEQNKLELDAFRRTLEKEGIDFAAFREGMRKDMIVNLLQRREVYNRITISDQEIDAFLSNNALQDQSNLEYRLGHILIALPEAASSDAINAAKEKAANLVQALRSGQDFEETAISQSDGQQALSGGDLGWRKVTALPTIFSDSVSGLEVGEVSDPMRSPSGYHIIKVVDKRLLEEQHLVQQTHARHILIRVDEFNSEKVALARINQLQQRLNGGEDFVALAKANSEDPGSSAKGGDLGWINPGQMVPPFETAMNELENGEISEPIRTPFGWHLIEVLERRSYDNTEILQRNKAREAIRTRKIEPAMDAWLRRLRDEAYIENRL